VGVGEDQSGPPGRIYLDDQPCTNSDGRSIRTTDRRTSRTGSTDGVGLAVAAGVGVGAGVVGCLGVGVRVGVGAGVGVDDRAMGVGPGKGVMVAAVRVDIGLSGLWIRSSSCRLRRSPAAAGTVNASCCSLVWVGAVA